MLSKIEARRFAKGVLQEKKIELFDRKLGSKDVPYIERQEKFIKYLDIVIEELSQ